jgi:hypothetical protein
MSKQWEWVINPDNDSWELLDEHRDFESPVIGLECSDIDGQFGSYSIFVIEKNRERIARVPQLEEQKAVLVEALQKIEAYTEGETGMHYRRINKWSKDALAKLED